MNEEIFITNKDDFSATHYFVYKNNEYPFKYPFFLLSSKYFLDNQEEIEKTKRIDLVDDDSENSFTLSEESIQSFIDFVQFKQIPLNNTNVTSLNYLAHKYEVSTLIKITDEYIRKNQKSLVLDILSLHKNDKNFNKETYEDIISENLEQYIKDERLLSLDVPIIYRIFSKFDSIKKSIKIESKTINDDINNFLFKCLDIYGQKASILFTFSFLETSTKEIIGRLIENYSKVFNFGFANLPFLTFLYEEDKKHIQKEAEQANTIEELKEEIEQHKNIIKEMNEKIDELSKEIRKQQSSDTVTINHNPNHEFNGIIKYLSDETGGNIHDNGTIKVTSNSILNDYHPKNLLNTEKTSQYQSDDNSFASICFDFKNRLIEISSYSIESCNWDKNEGHLKCWVIEISDDNVKWIEIDKHDKCNDLNGPNIIKTYQVKQNHFVRYVRFRHTCECWDEGTIGFNAIEFYGRLKMNT